MAAVFRARGINEPIADFHNAFFDALLAECLAAGLPVELEPDAECGKRVVLTSEAYLAPHNQRAAARQVAEIYAAMIGNSAATISFVDEQQPKQPE